MADNPFLALFPNEEHAVASKMNREKQDINMRRIMTRVLLVKGGTQLNHQYIIIIIITLENDSSVDELKHVLVLPDETLTTLKDCERVRLLHINHNEHTCTYGTVYMYLSCTIM